MNKHDPITLEIIQNSLRSISDEMFSTIAKTAMSPIIYEVLDMATAIVTPEAELASAGSGIPSFVGALDKSVAKVIEIYGAENIHDGDIFATNDPYYGGVTHLNDMVLLKPVFCEHKIISWTVNIAHWNDVGGKSPGSMSIDATEIFQEGIRVPAVRIFSQDKPIDSVFNMIVCNSRMPDFLKGDMWAQVSALRLGAKRIIELAEKYGVDTYLSAVEGYLNFGEQLARNQIRKLPDGIYSIQDLQDNGSILDVSMEVRGDELHIDLTNAPVQSSGPDNLSRDGTLLGCQMALMGLIGDREMANGGCFRPMIVNTKEGTIYHAIEPAACGIYFETMIRLNDLLWRCLAEQITDQLPAGNFSSICATIMGGTHPDTGRHYSIIEPEIGGWGAGHGFDGVNAMFSAMHGDTFNCPAEIAEARYGVTVGQMALNDEDGGAGEFRGGKGITLDYVIRNDQSFLTCAYTRSKEQPWGLLGGHCGTTNRINVVRTSGEVERHSMSTEVTVNKGDIVRVITANGAGYGDPKNRKRSAIESDLKNGYVSQDYAKQVYGFE
ncbi:hydantoinase B/oxoprolinase family protein [Pseudoalteromonas sp. KG3]|uniref:hydantoinase B/oxoprolinase family protein n=1 Tax=Pseudoalteromonas TaxID=53246 RepID=UPI00265AFA41|nr:hydantoinase B/oxoprolinase family protein [Pseudoalteromonas sp. KG3]WKD22889.1 hydantoinase B/oxoprolinase family protein [Pseudoalteromonas sp. KG3]